MADSHLIAAIKEGGRSLWRELSIYTEYKVRVWSLPSEYMAEDIVQMALERAVVGRRKWNQNRYPTAIEFLKSVVDSIVYERAHSKRGDESAVTYSMDREVEDEPHSARYRELLLDALLEIVADDDDLFAVLDGRLADISRKDIAAVNGMTPDEVTNATKRLFRKIRADFDQDLLDSDWTDHVVR